MIMPRSGWPDYKKWQQTFSRNWVFRRHVLLTGEGRQVTISGNPQESTVCSPGTFQGELDRIQQEQIIVPMGMDETSEWYTNFFLVPKANRKVWMCLDLAILYRVPIRPVHRGPVLNDSMLRLTGIIYLTVINASSGYHNLKIDKSHHI